MCECGVCALPLPTFAPPTCPPLFDPLALATFSPGASFSLLIPPVPPGRVERRKCDDALSLNAFNVRPRGRTWGTLNTSDGESLMPPVRLPMRFCHLFHPSSLRRHLRILMCAHGTFLVSSRYKQIHESFVC